MNEDELVLSSFCPSFRYLLHIIPPGFYEIPRFYIYVNHHIAKYLFY